MYIIKFSTQQHNGIYDMINNLKIIISVRGGELTFFAVFSFRTFNVLIIWNKMHIPGLCIRSGLPGADCPNQPTVETHHAQEDVLIES